MRTSQPTRQHRKWQKLFQVVPENHQTLFIGSFDDDKHGVLHIPEDIYRSDEPYGRKLTGAIFSVVRSKALEDETIDPAMATEYPVIWGSPYFEIISETHTGKKSRKISDQRISGANLEVTIDGKPTTISICSGTKKSKNRKGSIAIIQNSSISNIPFDKVHHIQF